MPALIAAASHASAVNGSRPGSLATGCRVRERESEERRRQAGQAFESCMTAERVSTGSLAEGHKGPSAEWREEDGPQNTVVGALGRIFDLIVVERPTRLTSLAEVTLEDA